MLPDAGECSRGDLPRWRRARMRNARVGAGACACACARMHACARTRNPPLKKIPPHISRGGVKFHPRGF